MNINVKTIPGGRVLVFEKQGIPPNGADNLILPVSLLITFWLVWQTHDWVYLALQENIRRKAQYPLTCSSGMFGYTYLVMRLRSGFIFLELPD